MHKTSIVVDPPDSPPARKIRQRTASDDAKKKDREARSIAIEKAYVHDVYEQISQHISDNRYRAWPRVKQFLQDLEPGSILCDVGKFNYLKFIYSENATKIWQNLQILFDFKVQVF